MKNQAFIAAAALAIAISGAQAADLPVDTPPLAATPAPASDWSGFYAGIHGGYSFGETDVSIAIPGPFAAQYDIDGWLAGVQAGYNVQSGMWLFGFEADIAYSSIDGSFSFGGNFPQTVTTDLTGWRRFVLARVCIMTSGCRILPAESPSPTLSIR